MFHRANLESNAIRCRWFAFTKVGNSSERITVKIIIVFSVYYMYFSLGYYDHRWRLDSLGILDDKDMKLGKIQGDVQVQTDGVFENCIALRGDAKIEFREINKLCDDKSGFTLYTLSFWFKYEEKSSQTIMSVGEFVNVTQSANAPDREHISVQVNTAKKKCFTSFFVSSEVWSHIIVSVNELQGKMLVYLDGSIVANSSRFVCEEYAEFQIYKHASLVSGGNGDVDFVLDDVRLLFDVLEIPETVKIFKEKTGLEI